MKEERRMILQMIEDGKITAEEGIALLEALEFSAKKENSKEEGANEKEAYKETYSEQKQEEKHNHYKYRDDYGPSVEDWKKDLKTTAEKLRDEFVAQGKTVGTKIGDLVEKVISKVKEMDFDFDFSLGNAVKVEKVFMGTPPFEGVIELCTENGKIEIEGWDRSEYRIEAKAAIRADNEHEANQILNDLLLFLVDEQQLTLKAEPRRGTKVSFHVYLPNYLKNDLKIVTSNGAIELEEISIAAAKLVTSNGSITLEETKADHLSCETSNGKIEMKDAEIGELNAVTSNGAIRMEGSISRAKCKTSNGAIRYSLYQPAEGSIDLETSNGSIEVKLPTEGMMFQGYICTSFGSLESLLPKTEILSVSKEASNRHLRFKSVAEEGKSFNINCRTTNGAIRLHPVDGSQQ